LRQATLGAVDSLLRLVEELLQRRVQLVGITASDPPIPTGTIGTSVLRAT
jgi:hypothetical protein